MRTIDFKKTPAYKARTNPVLIDIPEMTFVMVDGEGAPEDNPEFQQAMQVLYGIVYTIKFWDKKHVAPHGFSKFTLTPLEALWWSKKGKEFDSKDPSDWQWRVMIRVPEFVTEDFFKEVVTELVRNKHTDMYKKARLAHYQEGTSVQLMHIGPYDQEAEDIARMHDYARHEGYELIGKHHELYFSDPRRTAPEKLKTLIRHPVIKEA